MVISRVAEGRVWHALVDDEVVGRGHALQRPDRRVFLSIDAWGDEIFHQLAAAMLADLPAPLYTVVDDDDTDLLALWRSVGFAAHRLEREYVLPTDPRSTRLGMRPPPEGVSILSAGMARADLLDDLDRVVRAEVDATLGWQSMPAELLGRPGGGGVLYPSTYVVAQDEDGQYVGLARVAPLPRRPRLGLIAVRMSHRRRGVARGLLAEVLGSAHSAGVTSVFAEVDELNAPAKALFEGVGAKFDGGAVELVHR